MLFSLLVFLLVNLIFIMTLIFCIDYYRNFPLFKIILSFLLNVVKFLPLTHLVLDENINNKKLFILFICLYVFVCVYFICLYYICTYLLYMALGGGEDPIVLNLLVKIKDRKINQSLSCLVLFQHRHY